MKLLLDTHVFLQLIHDPALLVDELSRLPALHRDPFDRMLVAQARRDGLRLVTGDGRIRAYPVDIVWA